MQPKDRSIVMIEAWSHDGSSEVAILRYNSNYERVQSRTWRHVMPDSLSRLSKLVSYQEFEVKPWTSGLMGWSANNAVFLFEQRLNND